MKFTLDTHTGHYAIDSYGPGRIVVNGEALTRSILLTPGALDRDWAPQRLEDLRREDFEQLAAMGPEVVLLGCGARLRFPPAELATPLADAHIGLEVMDTGAACRTYNVLLSEGRIVLAALFMIETAVIRTTTTPL